jgi:uncharacterized protein
MPTTVLFHGNCPDGYAAAFACWQVFKEAAQYLPVFYGQPPPDIPAEDNVYIVDFSYPEHTLKELLAARIGRRKRDEHVITVLDHHASAQRDLDALRQQDLPGLSIHFDLAESGASLAWKYVHGWQEHDLRAEQALPLFFHYVRDRDLWQWQLPDSKPISLAYWTIDKTMEQIELFAQSLDEAEGLQRIVMEGRAMQRYADALIREQAARASLGVVGSYTVPIVNVTTLFSEVGDYLCTTQPEIPFCAYFFERSDGKRQWGLRGHGKVDLSRIAQQYGGGGHPNAAGFVQETPGPLEENPL